MNQNKEILRAFLNHFDEFIVTKTVNIKELFAKFTTGRGENSRPLSCNLAN